MTDLDDRSIYTALDISGMRSQIGGLPGQCRQAWEKAINLKLPPGYADITRVLILGMGGSAIGGDLLKALTQELSKPQVIVNRDYDLPAWVDNKTLVIAASYSGNTEETLSAFTEALGNGCKKLVISTGGKISALAHEYDVPVFTIEHISQPRAALGYALLPLLAIMSNLGFSHTKSADIEGMARTLERLTKKCDITTSTDNNPAKKLALKLYGKVTIIYGAGILSDIARRWKTQINENGKAWAFFEIFPELNHNAVVGYGYPEAIKDKIFVVLLCCPSLHARTLLRYQITGELLQQNNIEHEFVNSDGDNPFTQMMSTVLLGDWVSYYLAILNNIDPTPVPQIDFLKKRLAEA